MCGDDKDLIDGKPTGAVRVSFGYMSTLQDAQTCLQFLVDCFLENSEKPVFVKKILQNWPVSTENENIVNQSTELTVEVRQSVNKFVPDKEIVETSAGFTETGYHQNNVESNVKETFLNFSEHAAALKKIIPSVSDKVKLITKVQTETSVATDSGSGLNKISDVAIDHLDTKRVNDEYSNPVLASGRILTDIFVYPIKSCAAFKVSIVRNI